MIDDLHPHELTNHEQELVRDGLLLVQSKLKKLLKDMSSLPIDTEPVEAQLRILEGQGKEPGLLARFGYKEDESKPKKAKAGDPTQRTLDDEASAAAGDAGNEDLEEIDRFTWSKSKPQVAEHITKIIADNPPVEAIRRLNALEAGERQRDKGPRDNVLTVIRDARTPLTKKVGNLAVVDRMIRAPSLHELDRADPDCLICLGCGWTCEHHQGKPWSGMIGDELGCSPGCAGPGEPCTCNDLHDSATQKETPCQRQRS